MAFKELELDAVDTGNLRAFSEHALTCFKCSRSKTIRTTEHVCIKGVLLAAKAAAILRRHGIGQVDPRHIGTER